MTTATTTAADMNWTGRSGETVTGPDAARHLQATLRLLDERGWTRSHTAVDERTAIADADDSWSVKRLLLAVVQMIRDEEKPGPLTVYEALHAVSRGADGDADSWTGALRCAEAVLRARTGSLFAELSAWTEKRGRTFDEVRGLLTEAADFATEYGPTTA